MNLVRWIYKFCYFLWFLFWPVSVMCFSTYCILYRIHGSPLGRMEIKPVNSKGNVPWIFLGRTDAEAEATTLWPPDAKSRVLGKDPDAGKDRRQEKGTTEAEMVRCVWASSGRWWRTGRPGVLQSVGLQRVRHDWATELNWRGPGLASASLWIWASEEGTWPRAGWIAALASGLVPSGCSLLSQASLTSDWCHLPLPHSRERVGIGTLYVRLLWEGVRWYEMDPKVWWENTGERLWNCEMLWVMYMEKKKEVEE